MRKIIILLAILCGAHAANSQSTTQITLSPGTPDNVQQPLSTDADKSDVDKVGIGSGDDIDTADESDPANDKDPEADEGAGN